MLHSSPPHLFFQAPDKQTFQLIPFVGMSFAKNIFYQLKHKEIWLCFKKNYHGNKANDERQNNDQHVLE